MDDRSRGAPDHGGRVPVGSFSATRLTERCWLESPGAPLPQKQGTHSGTHPPAFGARAAPSSQPASRPAASEGARSPRLSTSFHGEPRGARPRACAVGASPQRPRPSPLPDSLGWGPSSPELLGSAHRPRPRFQTSQGGSEGSQQAQARSELSCC